MVRDQPHDAGVQECLKINDGRSANDPVCDILMAGAEDWAAATHWRIEHYS